MPPRPKEWIAWTRSAARQILEHDLKAGGFLFQRDYLSAEDAYRHYSLLPEFEFVVFSQFENRLEFHRKKANHRNGWIQWRFSAARDIIMEDLEPDGILYGKDNISTEEAFAFYSQEPAFAGVCLAQFKEQLKVHCKHGNKQRVLAQQEMTALLHDRVLFPQMSHNARGEPVFDLSEAKAFLKEDVSNNLHLTMTPCNLQKTRQVYMAFKPDIFKDRICQAV